MSEIANYTKAAFGPRQARAYLAKIGRGAQVLRHGPDVLGTRKRPEIGADYRTLSVARHLLLYRPQADQVIVIVRILHQSMDIGRHVGGLEE